MGRRRRRRRRSSKPTASSRQLKLQPRRRSRRRGRQGVWQGNVFLGRGRGSASRNARRQAEAIKKKKVTAAKPMPPIQTMKDFVGQQPGGESGLTFKDHWNPRDGWKKDLNGDGVVDLKDFNMAVYPQHKAYIRDWILSHQFDRNKYLDINQDGEVDMDDYYLAKDDSQKAAIKKYIEDNGGSLTGNRIHGLILHMCDAKEKEFIFSAQNEPETGLVGKTTGAVIRNIKIDETHEYHEAVQKFGTNIGRPIIRGVQWQGDDDSDSIKQAIPIIREKLPQRYSKFFNVDGTPRRLRGERGTIFKITKREDSNTVDVTEIQPKPDEQGYVLVISGDFEYGKGGKEFTSSEELGGIGNLKGMVRAGIRKPNTKEKLEQVKKRKTDTTRRTVTGGSRARMADTSRRRRKSSRRRRRSVVSKIFGRRRRRRRWFRRRRRRRWSDMMLKKNINYISTSPSGINVYEYNYIWSNKTYRGVMAQELLNKFPKAVSKLFGLYRVDYDMIDVNFEEIKNG